MNRLEEALGAYWDCAYQEGHMRRPDGNKANAILSEIRAAVEEAVDAEREATKAECAKVCDVLAEMFYRQARRGDNSGASDWKEYAARDCADEIRAL